MRIEKYWFYHRENRLKTDNEIDSNLNFLIPIYLQPDGVNLWCFKLRLFDLTEFIVWNFKGLKHRIAKI